VTKLTNSIEIESSPEKVFAFASDMKSMNEASKGRAEVEITSKGPIGVGTTMHFVGAAGGSNAEMDLEITEFVKNKKWAMHTIGASKTKMAITYTFEPTAKGTKVTNDTEYEVPYSILGKLIDKLKVKKDIEASNISLLENMKKALEA
jgi:coenzyme Q-binding protein COQ10